MSEKTGASNPQPQPQPQPLTRASAFFPPNRDYVLTPRPRADPFVAAYRPPDRVGGLLMYGIPNMKLEKEKIQRRVVRFALSP